MHLLPLQQLSLAISALLLLGPGHVQSMKAEQWKQRSIYQVITDRFAPTDASAESTYCDPSQRLYCGGTWQGIIRRLDYIQGMGFDAIWISPVTKQIDNTTDYGQAFHGYWQQDIYSLNPHFGTSSDLLALSSALHARGMALMLDIVVNHFGSPYQVDYSIYHPFNDGSYFHEEAFITDYNNQTMVEQGWLGNGQVPLPDVDTENPKVVSTFNAWISDLVQTYQIDGLRLDTVKHVRKDFWPGFVSASGVFALGEVLSGDPKYLSAYQPYTGGLLDYGTYYPLLRAFTSGGSMTELAALIAPSYRALFSDTQLLGAFMENHDMPRFSAIASSDTVVVQNAMAYTLLSDGIPIIYYGQEQGFTGSGDPQNREPMWSSGFKTTTLYTFLGTLNQARSLAWSAGFGTNLTTGLYVDNNVFVTQKGPLLMVLSNQGSGAVNKTVSFSSQFSSGTILVDVLQCTSILVGKSNTVTVMAGKPQVYLPQGLAQRMCSNIQSPVASSSVMSKLTSLFTSSSKAAAKSATKSSQASYSSGTASITSTGLAILKSSSVSTIAPLPTSKSTTDAQSIYSTTTSKTAAAAGRPVFNSPNVATSTGYQSATSATTQSSSTQQTSSTKAGRPVFNAPVVASPTTQISSSKSSTTIASSSTTTRSNGRPAFNSPNTNQKRSPGAAHSNESRSPIIGNRPHTPQQQQGGNVLARKAQHTRQMTTPPASLSQHYRADRSGSNIAPGQSGLSSMYSYSASHLPLPGKFSESQRSSSETNLAARSQNEVYKKGHTPQSQSLHTLKKRGSSNSLMMTTARTSSFGGGVPPVPPLSPRLDTRAALFADNAAHVHTNSLTSPQLPHPHYTRSRRSSNGSIRSVYSVNPADSAARQRQASYERQNLLAQENGVAMPYVKPGFTEHASVSLRANSIMSTPANSRSKSSLHGDRSHVGLPNHRRHDNRAQLQEDVRQFRV